jgi:hypothetical protein
MIVVVLVTVAAPARAEADVLLILGIVSFAIAGVILISYLIIAAGSDRGGEDAHLDEPPSALVARLGQAS